MTQQIPLGPDNIAGHPAEEGAQEILPDLALLRLMIVNVVLVGPRQAADRGWVLVDADLPDMRGHIHAAAAVPATEMPGPPMYDTQDWPSARDSVARLAALAPETVLTGHGRAMHGPAVRAALDRLAREFDRVAHPPGSRYDAHPIHAEDGTAYVRR